MLQINVGCGATPTPGWLNIDNSPSVLLAKLPIAARALIRLGLITQEQLRFIETARRVGIRYASAATSLPVADGAADVVYSSHMLEHLDRAEVDLFLAEVQRVLSPAGVLRLALPDLRRLADAYLDSGDADGFVGGLHMSLERPRTMRQRVTLAALGHRQHHWMYDGASLTRLLTQRGFSDAQVMPAGSTMIENPGALDLREREDESVYVEARKI